MREALAPSLPRHTPHATRHTPSSGSQLPLTTLTLTVTLTLTLTRMIKWLTEITVTAEESSNHFHYMDNRVLPEFVDAERATAEGWWYKPDYIINELNINSAIANPGEPTPGPGRTPRAAPHLAPPPAATRRRPPPPAAARRRPPPPAAARRRPHGMHSSSPPGHPLLTSTLASPRAAHKEILQLTGKGQTYTMSGYCYSGGGRKVIRVEVSLDGGKTWTLTTLRHPETPTEYCKYWCWRRGALKSVASPQKHPGLKSTLAGDRRL
jgi:hypothetical protein